ncbi:29641_t:CDS:2, partial [Racocetra persica]
MLHEEMSFSNWDIVLETIGTFAKQNGFTFKKECVEHCLDSIKDEENKKNEKNEEYEEDRSINKSDDNK